ncbi:MAG: VWA domain-containing protein [Acidobacteriota bacterium]|nr:VWA domain-containing protein [Acidobacteriota bacterium]
MFSAVRLSRLMAAAAVAGAVTVPALAQSPVTPEKKPGEARVHISVTDDDGKALAITAGDVSIEEDGRAREVLRVEKASDPLQIALLVDDSQAAQSAIAEIRAALKQVIGTVLEANPDSQIALISFGERPTLLVDYTNSRAQLERGANRIFARPGSGAYMLEAIVSATRGVAKRRAARPHIVVIGTEGVEFSNDHFQRVLDNLSESGATLWALTLTAGPRAGDTDETRNRAVVLGRGTTASGGRHDQVLANSALPSRLDAVAQLLLNQYAVTFGRPDSLVPPESIAITVSLPGARVLAPDTPPRATHAGPWQ